VRATSIGQDALGEVTVKVQFGNCECSKPVSGKGAATDVIEASARAYLNAVNRNISLAALAAATQA
jgi:2-isopropylmalate synthase